MKLANQLKPNQSDVVLAYFEALVRDNQKAAAEKLVRDFINQQKTFGATYDRLYVQYMIDKRLDDAERDPEAEDRRIIPSRRTTCSNWRRITSL